MEQDPFKYLIVSKCVAPSNSPYQERPYDIGLFDAQTSKLRTHTKLCLPYYRICSLVAQRKSLLIISTNSINKKFLTH